MAGIYLGRLNVSPNVSANSGFSAQSLGGEPDISGLGYTDRKNIEYNAFQAAQDRKFNSEQAELSRKFNASEAQKTRDWQEAMSNSAYSRAISDLKSAGVNPYALLSGMSSASTPTGATGSGTSAYSSSHTGTYEAGAKVMSAFVKGVMSGFELTL